MSFINFGDFPVGKDIKLPRNVSVVGDEIANRFHSTEPIKNQADLREQKLLMERLEFQGFDAKRVAAKMILLATDMAKKKDGPQWILDKIRDANALEPDMTLAQAYRYITYVIAFGLLRGTGQKSLNTGTTDRNTPWARALLDMVKTCSPAVTHTGQASALAPDALTIPRMGTASPCNMAMAICLVGPKMKNWDDTITPDHLKFIHCSYAPAWLRYITDTTVHAALKKQWINYARNFSAVVTKGRAANAITPEQMWDVAKAANHNEVETYYLTYLAAETHKAYTHGEMPDFYGAMHWTNTTITTKTIYLYVPCTDIEKNLWYKSYYENVIYEPWAALHVERDTLIDDFKASLPPHHSKEISMLILISRFVQKSRHSLKILPLTPRHLDFMDLRRRSL